MIKNLLIAVLLLVNVVFVSATSYIQLTTTSNVGDVIKFGITADANSDAWIDLDNNGKRGYGEEVTQFAHNNRFTLALKSQTFRIYGKITELYASRCNLEQIDIRNNIYLKSLYVGSNSLTYINIAANTALDNLNVSHNKLSTLNVAKNINLKFLDCSSNNIYSLDVSKLVQLEKFHVGSNPLISFDVSKNTQLITLDCSKNNLSTIDLSKNTHLQNLYCGKNKLSNLSLSPNLNIKYLSVGHNLLTSLDVSNYPQLVGLYCSNNAFNTLNVSMNTDLEYLTCDSLGLKSLDISKNLKLKRFSCVGNNLRLMNLSMHKSVYTIKISQNNLIYCNLANGRNSKIDYVEVSSNPALTCIQIDNGFTPGNMWFKDGSANWSATPCPSQIPVDNVSLNKKVLSLESSKSFQLEATVLPVEAANKSVSWHSIDSSIASVESTGLVSGFAYGTTDIVVTTDDGAFTDTCHVTVVPTAQVYLITNKNIGETFSFIINAYPENQNDVWIDVNSNHIKDAGEEFNQFSVTKRVSVPVQSDAGLTIYGKLSLLDCSSNNLTNISFQGVQTLQMLNCSSNELSYFDASTLSELQTLDCSNNKIKELDFSSNNVLHSLNSKHNNLESLNLANGNNPNFLSASSSVKYAVDVTNNPNLTCILIDSNFDPSSMDATNNKWLKDDIAEWNDKPCDDSAVEEAVNSNVKVWSSSSCLYMSNLKIGDRYVISDLSGRIVNQSIVHSLKEKVNLSRGLYILRIEKQTFKVMITE